MGAVVIALVLFLAALVGAPIAMRARARSASYGTAPVSDDPALAVYRSPVKARWNQRRFGPARIYDLVIRSDAVGIVISQQVDRPARIVGSKLYPAWWFRKDEVRVGGLGTPSSESNFEVTFSYRKDGETQVVAVSSPSKGDLVAALRTAGWAPKPDA
jgi:hypothetical protein